MVRFHVDPGIGVAAACVILKNTATAGKAVDAAVRAWCSDIVFGADNPALSVLIIQVTRSPLTYVSFQERCPLGTNLAR
ncbi:hypothetical protein ABIB48_000116 [Arthrobacter sp. UYCu511]